MLLQFDLASLYGLDVFYDDTYGPQGQARTDDTWTPPPAKLNVIINHGVYFGEVLRRRFGGSWRESRTGPKSPLTLELTFPDGMTVFPVSRAFKRMKNGSEDSFLHLAQVIHGRLGGTEASTEADGWLAQAAFFIQTHRSAPARVCLERATRLNSRHPGLRDAQTQLAALEAPARPAYERTSAGFDFAAYCDSTSAPLLRERHVVPDFSAASVAAIDLLLSTLWGNAPTPDVRETPEYRQLELDLGVYLGELFVRRWGGTWLPGSTTVPFAHVSWPSGFVTCPFTYFSKRAENGAERSVTAQVDHCRALLLAKGVTLPTVPPSAEAASWLEQAKRLASSGRVALATSFAEESLAVDPSQGQTHLLLARWLRTAGDAESLTEAHKHLEQAARLLPNEPEPLVALLEVTPQHEHTAVLARLRAVAPTHPLLLTQDAAALLRAGRAADALAKLDSLPADAPRSPELCLVRGRALITLGRFADAVTALRAATPTSMELELALGEAHEGAKQLVLAVARFKNALDTQRLPPSDADTLRAHVAQLERSPAFFIEKSIARAKAGKLQESAALLQELLSHHPKHGEAARELVVVLSRLERFDEALEYGRRAIEWQPEDARSYDNTAVLLGRMGRFADGLRVLDDGLARHPRYGPMLFRRGNFTARQGDYEAAIGFLKRALDVNPRDPEALLTLADVQQRLSRRDEALELLQRLLHRDTQADARLRSVAVTLRWQIQHPGARIDREGAERLQDRAMSALNEGRAREALSFWSEAVEANPASVELWHNRGTCALRVLDPATALTSFERACELSPGMELFEEARARALLRLDRATEALAALDAITTTPPSTDVLLTRVEVLGALGRHDEALALLEQGQPKTASDERWFAAHLRALKTAKRFDAALAALDTRIAATPENRRLWADKASVLSELGRADESYALMNKALQDKAFADEWEAGEERLMQLLRGEEAPSVAKPAGAVVENSVDAWLERAMVHVKAGQLTQALGCFEKATQVDPNHAVAWKDRGLCLLDLGRHAESLPFFERAITLRPAMAQAYYSKAVALKALGRLPECVDAFERYLAVEDSPPELWLRIATQTLEAQRATRRDLVALGLFDAYIEPYLRIAATVTSKPVEQWLGVADSFRLTRPEVAFHAFGKVLEFDPTLTTAWLFRAARFVELQQPNEALQCFENVVALEASNAPAWLGKGLVERSLRRMEAAAASLRRYLQLAPGAKEPAANLEKARRALSELPSAT